MDSEFLMSSGRELQRQDAESPHPEQMRKTGVVWPEDGCGGTDGWFAQVKPVIEGRGEGYQ